MFSPDKKEKNDQKIPSKKIENASINPLDDYKIGDTLGAFSAYNRRPKASSLGLTACFFGENGVDADIITALHLTHYQDLPVKISVWLIKDSNGKIIKGENGYPKITEFIGSIRRPKPTNYGQTALFFGANGINADAINLLNKTEYVDAFVFIDIQLADAKVLAKDIVTIDPLKEMDKESEKLTPVEIKKLARQQKRAQDADKILIMSSFYTKDEVLRAIGRDEDYKEWISKQPCCHPGSSPCSHLNVFPYYFNDGRNKNYLFVPVCEEHAKEWDTGSIDGATNLIVFFQTKRRHLLQVWAKERLKEKMGIPFDYEIPPSKMYEWVCENNLNRYLNASYMNFMD